MNTKFTFLACQLLQRLWRVSWPKVAGLAALLLGFSSNLHAQTIDWQKTYGGSKKDQVSFTQQTQDGGYILGGYSNSDKGGTKSENGRGKDDYWVIKLDAAGNKQWDKTFGGSDIDRLKSMQQTQDGGYILGGITFSGKSGDKSAASKGDTDYWIIKLDAQGNKQWDKTLGGNSYDDLRSLQQTQDGGYILGGFSYSSKSGDKTQASKGGADYWVVKLQANGAKEWDKTIGGNDNDQLYSIRQTPDGGYILGGSSNSFMSGDKSEDNRGKRQDYDNVYFYDYWIVKLNASGQKEWDKTLGGTETETLASVVITPDNGYVVGGTSASGKNGDKSEADRSEIIASNTSPGDYWVVKLESDGTKVWDKVYGGISSDQLASLVPTLNGGFILGGSSNSDIGGDKSEAGELGGSWIVKIDAAGNKIWDKTFGKEKRGILTSIQPTQDGNYIAGGYTYFRDENNGETEDLLDFWVAKIIDTNKKGQTITYNDSKRRTPADGSFIPTAMSSSGLPLVYELLSGPAKLQGSLVTPTDGGVITLKATQPGNAAYLPAPEVIIKININLPVPVTTLWDRTIGGIHSQTPEEDFHNILKDYGQSELKDMVKTPDGGYLLGGTSDSEKGNDKSETHQGYYDYWVVKLDATGNKVWDRTFGGRDSDYLYALVATADGGYLLAGSSSSGKSGDKSEANRANCSGEPCALDYWVIKIDANGNKLWDKIYGGVESEFLTDVVATTDNGFLLGGYSESGKGGDKSQTNTGGQDFWVVKIDANGNKLWDKTLGGNGDEKLSSIALTDSGFLLGGTSGSSSSGDKSEASKGATDFWVVQIDLNGQKVWDKTLGTDGADALSAIIALPDKGFLLGGGSNISSFDFLLGQYELIKIDKNGNKVWEKFYSGKYVSDYSNQAITAMAATPDGGYLLGGFSSAEFGNDKSEFTLSGPDKNVLGSNPVNDYWVIKTDNLGNKIWDKTLGGTNAANSKGYDNLEAIIVNEDGSYVLGGTSSSDKSGDKSENLKGFYDDYWVIKIQEDQPITTAWDMRYGSSGTDNFTSVIKTQDGGYLSAGYTNSGASGDKTQSSQGKNDYWIVKSDKNGKKLWDKRFGGSENDYLNRVIQTQDGGYLLAGSSFSGKTGDKSQANKGDRDYWLVKTDKLGNKEWDKTYGGSGYDELQKVIQLSTGEYVLGGYSNSPTSGDKSQNSQGSYDYWLVKIAKNGTKLWDKRYGGGGAETLGSFIQTPDGGYLLGGSSLSGKTGDKSQSSKGASDYWVVKTDKNGNLVWEKTLGSSNIDEAYSIGISANNNYFIAGTSSSGKSGDKTQASKGGKDYWLVSLDQNGTKQWDKTFGGSKDDELRASAYTSQGHYVLAGHSYSDVSGDKTQNSQGESDYWIVEVDKDGSLVQDQRYGGSGKEELRTVTQTQDGGLLLAGRSDSGVSGDRTQPSQGSTDYWLVKVAPETSPVVAVRQANLAEEPGSQNASMNLQAYPNPFQEKLTVSFSVENTQAVHLEAYDNQGRKVATLYQGQAQGKQVYQVEWQASKQAGGLYFLRLQTAGKVHHQKVLLSK